MRDLDFERDGAALHAGAALSLVQKIEDAVVHLPAAHAGIRISNNPALATVVAYLPMAALMARHTGIARAVRAILFDKTPMTNWALGWHQDRTIAVRQRRNVPGYGPWTIKAGMTHVEPPFAVIEHMVTVRIHLDDVPADNAPLLIAPGSHRLGRIAEADVGATVARCGTHACLAERGDVWAYATPILHASGPSVGADHRRVLQIDFSAVTLPPDLEWLGIG